ncbi:hypothetical protein DDE18_06670 [Nocardioides gansuensis]|uniref:Glycosyl transferase family 1 domain-containing protein n=1 Tax=Nocardioides gansuensis TaxID=2138300 RepID=A0A2T8FE24_9ACTN|nr:glycosyltransferase [Nocardioides gansuensis]PVG83957.1 hypothetical protein DDE18_06670 [Nocardioides gansuensis]
MHLCTVAAAGQLAHASVLVESFWEHHPGAAVTILLLDEGTVPAGVDVLRVADLGIDDHLLDRMSTAYTADELRCALKTWLLDRLLDDGADVVFLEPETWVLQPLTDLPALLEAGIVLAPRLTAPLPQDGKRPTEQELLLWGTIDPGFVALRPGAAARDFVSWWQQRMATDCFDEPRSGFFLDGRMLDHAVHAFPVHVHRDPGWDLVWWNMPTRPLQRAADGTPTVEGRPLAFVRFPGYAPEAPYLISAEQPEPARLRLSEHAVLRALTKEYADRLRLAGHPPEATDSAPVSVRDGVELTAEVRRHVRHEFVAQARGGGTGLMTGTEGSLDLLAWLMTAEREDDQFGLGRLLTPVYLRRPDLQQYYPQVWSGNIADFLDWCEMHGAEEHIPVAVARAIRDRLTSSTTTPGYLEVRDDDRTEARRRRTHGVEVTGFLRAELGLGGSARLAAEGLREAGVPVSTTTYTRTSSRQGTPWRDWKPAEGERHDTLLICTNADMTPTLLADAGDEYLRGRYRIALWFWELDDFPDQFRPALDMVDEIWASSDFNRQVLSAATDKPVVTIPHPVHAPARPTRMLAEFADDVYTFLFVFDFFSVLERKNPLALVEAFARAFPTPGEARLVIKSINAAMRPVERERLAYVVADRPDIVLIERYLSREELDALMWRADCYVSLHRSEGFGQTIAEMMAIGRPAIATAYSGNLDFMTPENSRLVDYTLVPVPPGCDPYPETSSWAEPDIDQAARAMRELKDDPELGRQLGERAASTIAEGFTTATQGQVAAARLQELWDMQDARRQARRERKQRKAAAQQLKVEAESPSGGDGGPWWRRGRD